VPAAVNRHLAGQRSAANPLHAAAAVESWDGRSTISEIPLSEASITPTAGKKIGIKDTHRQPFPLPF